MRQAGRCGSGRGWKAASDCFGFLSEVRIKVISQKRNREKSVIIKEYNRMVESRL